MLVHIGSFLNKTASDQPELGDVFVDLHSGQFEVVTIVAFAAKETEQLIHECDVVDRNGEFDMTTMARTAEQSC
jgi:hypothetical protein